MTRSSESEIDLEVVDVQLERTLEPGEKSPVLGDVVGCDADDLAARVEHGSVGRLENEAVGGRTRISSRAAVGEELGSHVSSNG